MTTMPLKCSECGLPLIAGVRCDHGGDPFDYMDSDDLALKRTAHGDTDDFDADDVAEAAEDRRIERGWDELAAERVKQVRDHRS